MPGALLPIERILGLQLFHHEYYGWASGSWVVGYFVHFSRHSIKRLVASKDSQ